MVKIRKTWHFHSLTLFAVTTLKNKKPLQLQRKKNHKNPNQSKKIFTSYKFKPIIHYTNLYEWFSLSWLKSIEFICSQIPFHYQSAKTYRPVSTGKHAIKIVHHFLAFPCSPSMASSTLVLVHSLYLQMHILLHFKQAFMWNYIGALILLSSVVIPVSAILSPPFTSLESSIKLEIKPQIYGKHFCPRGKFFCLQLPLFLQHPCPYSVVLALYSIIY